jgi:hypothetical protein
VELPKLIGIAQVRPPPVPKCNRSQSPPRGWRKCNLTRLGSPPLYCDASHAASCLTPKRGPNERSASTRRPIRSLTCRNHRPRDEGSCPPIKRLATNSTPGNLSRHANLRPNWKRRSPYAAASEEAEGGSPHDKSVRGHRQGAGQEAAKKCAEIFSEPCTDPWHGCACRARLGSRLSTAAIA